MSMCFQRDQNGGFCCFSLPVLIHSSCNVFIIILWPVTGSSGVLDHLDTDGKRLSAACYIMLLACHPRTRLVSSRMSFRRGKGGFLPAFHRREEWSGEQIGGGLGVHAWCCVISFGCSFFFTGFFLDDGGTLWFGYSQTHDLMRFEETRGNGIGQRMECQNRKG
ncbi:hypothetical protein QBC36DRAFT_70793 [Triangularia setosa]|uniref:Uncharacterized protein n=1 Tax=Triangularia setosa TaxID=2587417 RepID=A0AAN6W1P6_9PEZI|nr:hypothetical protein QBC36DRAFT_70793 [Podospora setosa]